MAYGKKLKILGAIIGKSLIFGLSILFTGKLARTSDVLDVLALRFLISAIFLLLFRQIGIIKVNYKNKNLKMLAFAAILEPLIYYSVETLGITYSSTTISGTILSLISAVIILGEFFILKYKFDIRTTGLVLLRIIGAIIISTAGVSSGTTTVIGIIFLLLTVFTDAAYVLFLKKLTADFAPIEIVFFTALIGAAVFNSANLARHIYNGSVVHYFDTLLIPENFAGLLYLGLGATIIAMFLTTYVMKHVKPSYMSAFGGLSTIITILSGVIVNKEIPDAYQIVGIILLLSGAVGASFLPESANSKNGGKK